MTQPLALYDPTRHEPLRETTWDSAVAQSAIQQIVDDTHANFDEHRFWPIHPLDRSPERADTLKPVYYGAAGVIWALDHLGANPPVDASTLDRLLEGTRADADRLYPESRSAFLMGETGVMMLQFQRSPTQKVSRQLKAAIRSNLTAGPEGLVWGLSGTVLASLFLFEATADTHWLSLYLEGCDALYRLWVFDEELQCHLWTQDLYGHVDKLLGGLHGFAANAGVLLRGIVHQPPPRQTEIVERIGQTLVQTARTEANYANWPLVSGPSTRPSAANVLIQHCNGAPGIVNCLSRLPEHPQIDSLFLRAGNLIWDAGALKKMPSLCHGIPGSGYALLKLFERTGNTLWLDRARRFAMHAIEQNDRYVRQHGQRKYSLWTGDLGLAVYLQSCTDGAAALPTLDVF